MTGTERKFRKLYLGRHRGASQAFISSLELIGETLGRTTVTEAGMDEVGGGDACCSCCSFILPLPLPWELLAIASPPERSGDARSTGTEPGALL